MRMAAVGSRLSALGDLAPNCHPEGAQRPRDLLSLPVAGSVRRDARSPVAALLGMTMAAMLVLPIPVRAQQPAQPLSLADALRLAERGNPRFRQAANDVDVAEAQRRREYGGYFPSLSLNMGFDGSGSQTLTGEDDFGNPIRGDRRTIRSSSARQGLSMNMTLFDGGARERRIGAAKEGVRAAEADVGAQRAQLHAEVAAQYYRVQAAQARLALEERLVAAAREQLDATQRRFRIAAVNREDVLGAEADLARAEAQLESARGDVRKAMLALRERLGVETATEFALVDSIPRPASDSLALDADSLVRVAFGRHPSLRAAEARSDAADATARAARGARWPSISATASFTRSDRASDFGAFGDVDPRGTQGYGFGLSTTLPFFDRFQTGASIAQADASAEDARQQRRADRLRVEQEVRSAAIDVDNARRALRLGERAAALSRERVELARARYEAGALDFVQYQSVVRSSADAERQEADARLQLALAWVTLQQRLGAPAGAP